MSIPSISSISSISSSSQVLSNLFSQPAKSLDKLPVELFRHCISFLGPRELPPVRLVSRACNTNSQRVQSQQSLLKFSPELIQYMMTFLDRSSLTLLADTHRQMGTLTRHPDALNPSSFISWKLEHSNQFKRIYEDCRVKKIIYVDESATLRCSLKSEGKHYLVILPHPQERQIARRKGSEAPINVLDLIDLDMGKKRQFVLDRVFQKCYSMQEPEPALILLDSSGQVLKITLSQILQSENILVFGEEAIICPGLANLGEENWGSYQWDSVFVANHGSLLAVACQEDIRLFDLQSEEKKPVVSFPFKQPHPLTLLNLSFYDQKLLAFSGDQISLFEKNKEGKWESHPINIPFSNPDIKSAILSGSNIFIGFTESMNNRNDGIYVGVVYNINTNECSPLLDHFGLRNPSIIKHFIRFGNYVSGISSRFNVWNDRGWLPMEFEGLKDLDRPNTLKSLGDSVILANQYGIAIFSSFGKPNTKWLQDKFLLDKKDKIVCVELNGHFLTVVSCNMPYESDHIEKITVYNLLETSEKPLEAGPALDLDPYESKED